MSNDDPRRILVFGWEPRWEHLPLALLEHARTIPSASLPGCFRIVLIGKGDPSCWTHFAASHPPVFKEIVEYLPCPEDWPSIESLIEALLPESAHSLLVLPDRSRPDPDSHSRRICARLRAGRKSRPPPHLVVVIADPDAQNDFSAFQDCTILHEDSLRATLLASASMDVAAFRAIEEIIAGQEVLLEAPVPEALRFRTFGDALIGLDELPDGTPISLLGVRQSQADASQSLWIRLVRGASLGTESGIFLAPGFDFPLATATSLVILAPRSLTWEEIEEAALRACSRQT